MGYPNKHLEGGNATANGCFEAIHGGKWLTTVGPTIVCHRGWIPNRWATTGVL